jgi:hypothetical protein
MAPPIWRALIAPRAGLPPGAADAARVRALADSVRWESPGFASDLYAAAARHDGDRDGPLERDRDRDCDSDSDSDRDRDRVLR